MVIDKLADWCKWLEKNFSNEIMIPTLPVIIRLDGNNFSTWTKNFIKPFDENFNDLMIETMKFLVKETNAVIGYTQSDEITLILYSDNRRSGIYNDGKKQKILSKLTGLCVDFFNEKRREYLPEQTKSANFDCRIYQTPTLKDAYAQLLWRENDAIRNSILMLSYSHYSHNEVMNLNTTVLKEKLKNEKNIIWDDLHEKFKRGTYVKKFKSSAPYTYDILMSLPPKHHAHTNPDLCVERTTYDVLDIPLLNTIEDPLIYIFSEFFDK